MLMLDDIIAAYFRHLLLYFLFLLHFRRLRRFIFAFAASSPCHAVFISSRR